MPKTTKKERIKVEDGYGYCRKCEKSKPLSQFYEATNLNIDTSGKLSVCRDCCNELYHQYFTIYNNLEIALDLTCRDLDIVYDEDALIQTQSHIDKLLSNGKTANAVFGYYKSKLSSLNKNNTGMESFRYKDSPKFKQDEVNTSIKCEEVKKPIQILEVEITEEDKKSKEDTIRLLGYDPFNGYEKSDQKYLYNELILYLDEDTLEDPFKIGVVIQIVINNNQIRKANISINSLGTNVDSMIKNAKEINALTDMTTKWNQQNDRLSKENNIALKHRGSSSSKNSTLGSMMKNLRELGFEKAEHDYYDTSKAYGMKFSADIGNQSILDVVHFDDNDANNVFKMQREKLQELQDKELDYKEEIRKLLCDNAEKEKLINELQDTSKDVII